MTTKNFTKKTLFQQLTALNVDTLIASLITESIFVFKDQELKIALDVIRGDETSVARLVIDRDFLGLPWHEMFAKLPNCPDHLISCQHANAEAYINAYCGQLDEDSFTELAQFAVQAGLPGVLAVANAIQEFAKKDYSRLLMAA
jgi:hypothetical protein